MVSGRTLTTSDEISAVRCYDQTRTRAASIFSFSHLTWNYIQESTVGVALGSHIVERKRVVAENRCFPHCVWSLRAQNVLPAFPAARARGGVATPFSRG